MLREAPSTVFFEESKKEAFFFFFFGSASTVGRKSQKERTIEVENRVVQQWRGSGELVRLSP
jgi:hypothetical protein